MSTATSIACYRCGNLVHKVACHCESCNRVAYRCGCMSRQVVNGILRPPRCKECNKAGCAGSRTKCPGMKKTADTGDKAS